MSSQSPDHEVLERERAHHDALYSGFAQQHFTKPAVVAFRRRFLAHLIRRAGIHAGMRVLSLGCGIGDLELMLAPYVAEVTGIDLSEPGIAQANHDLARSGIGSVRFIAGTYDSLPPEEKPYDLILAKFFLHHLPRTELERIPAWVASRLSDGGVFYSLDPNRYRLSGAIGKLLLPDKMRQFQTEDESPLSARELREVFERAGFAVETAIYDYLSTPFGGLFPSWKTGYVLTRAIDDVLVRIPGLRVTGSSVEMLARKR